MDIKDILTLSDGNQYVIASKTTYEYKIYLYLVDMSNHQNIKLGYLDNDEIVLVKKETISDTLLLKLMNNIIKDLKS